MHSFIAFCFFGTLLVATNLPPSTHGNEIPSSIPVVTHVRPMDLKSSFNRTLKAPLVRSHEESSDAAWEHVKSLARTISSLQPTFVSGILKISEPGTLHSFAVDAFQWTRNEVLAANPHCRFDVEINVSNYATAAELIESLQEVASKVAPDAVLMVVSKSNEIVSPTAVAKGIEFAHAHHQLVGYEGPLSMIPDGVDFLVMRTETAELHREQIALLRAKHHLPLLLEASFLTQEKDASSLNMPLTQSASAKEASLLTRLAEGQNGFGYHFMYPIAFPAAHGEKIFDKASDRSLLVMMRALMARYN